jgi:hypothetical protein
MKTDIMDQQELADLRDALSIVLAWRDDVRAQVARWLTPEVSKPNGKDPSPPMFPPWLRALKGLFANPAKVQAAERRLLAT